MSSVLGAALAALWALASVGEAQVWTQWAKLTAGDAAARDNFGASVAISGNTAIVGALGDDDAGDYSGSAYLFDVPTGQQLFKLTADDAAAWDWFGSSVAISRNTVVVGADGDDDAGDDSGSAYLFDAASGEQLFKLTADDGAARVSFGRSVGISGNTAIVGAPYADEAGIWSGSAYVFHAATGEQFFKLTADDAAAFDKFGWSVAIRANTAIVGAYGDDGAGDYSGSAYLFDVPTGQQLFKLTADDAAAGDWFGSSVAMSRNTVVVGAPNDDDAGDRSGSAYLFDLASGEQLFKLTANDAAAEDEFGFSVGISGNTAVVGAWADDDAGTYSGSAYLFDVATGEQLFKLTDDDAAARHVFGRSVGISGNTAIVGAGGDDEAGFGAGSAYIFVPEPSSLLLLAMAALGLLAYARRRRGGSVAGQGRVCRPPLPRLISTQKRPAEPAQR